jgi:hypothetical protein
MRIWLSVFLAFTPATVFADSLAVRPLDHSAAATLAGALEHSALVRSLVAELDAAVAIVHFEVSLALPSSIGAATRFVVSAGDHTYLRVTVSAMLRSNEREILLGHELQHALDIARSGATNQADVQRLLVATGYRTGSNLFETGSALRTERRIRAEFRQSAFRRGGPRQRPSQ